MPIAALIGQFDEALGEDAAYKVAATQIAGDLLGDTIATNLIMVGYAYQSGLLPLQADAIMLAIERNGVAIALNQAAFRLGRLAVHDSKAVSAAMKDASADAIPQSFDEIVAHRTAFLKAYQNTRYSEHYRRFVTDVRDRSIAVDPGARLGRAVAISLAQLMTYKDEYEVARLLSDKGFRQELRAAGSRVEYHLAPPILARRDPVTGHLKKMRFGSWIGVMFPVLAALHRLRGTPLDLLGYSTERRNERALIAEFRAMIESVLSGLVVANLDTAVRIAEAAQDIRGYGHVKDRNIVAVRERWSALRGTFAAPTDDRSMSHITRTGGRSVRDELTV